MAQRGACGGRPVAIDDMYECDEVARDTQLEAFFQRTEEWFDALSKQLTVLARSEEHTSELQSLV